MANDSHSNPADRDLASLPVDLSALAGRLRADGAAWRDETDDETARIEGSALGHAQTLAGAPRDAGRGAPETLATADIGELGQLHDATRPARPSRRPRGLLAIAATIGIVALLTAVLHGMFARTGIEPPPAGWQTRTPPTGEQFASYAVSPDVPGLIVACIGDQTPHVSAGKMGPAHIWRSRDGGRHWQQLPSPLTAGCSLTMPPGGSGMIFASDPLGQGAISVSRDGGDTWRQIATPIQAPNAQRGDPFALLGHTVYRDGRLYGLGATILSVSDDDGATWTPQESSPDPLVKQSYVPLSLAADYSAPKAWFRVLGRGPNAMEQNAASAAASSAAYLQHSADDGRTWTTLSPTGPTGAPYSYQRGSLSIATTPSHPGRVCAAFAAAVGQLTRASAAAHPAGAALAALGAVPAITLGPPYREPLDVAIEASSDGGHTWTGGTIVHHQHNEGSAGGAAMDQQGNCFLADNAPGSGAAGTPTSDATIWRLRPGQTAAEPAYTIPGRSAQSLGVSPSGEGQSAQLLAVVETPQPPIICQGDVCPPYSPHPPQLLATTLP